MERTLITQDRLEAILKHAALAPDIGLFAECGVYKGGSLKLLAQTFPKRTCLGFDTFEGLPVEQWNELEIHHPKDFSDTSLEEVESFIKRDNVKLIKGLFPDSAKPFENETFAFVHVDFDFYEGIKACLDFFWPRLEVGGMIVLDDYGWVACPGVKKALDEFPHAKAFITAHTQAGIKK